jgi:hypothetical protein
MLSQVEQSHAAPAWPCGPGQNPLFCGPVAPVNTHADVSFVPQHPSGVGNVGGGVGGGTGVDPHAAGESQTLQSQADRA